MGIFYDSAVELLGVPNNFGGEVLIYSLAFVGVILVGAFGFIVVCAVLRRLLR